MTSNSTAWNVARIGGVCLLVLVVQGIPIVGTAVLLVVALVAMLLMSRRKLNA